MSPQLIINRPDGFACVRLHSAETVIPRSDDALVAESKRVLKQLRAKESIQKALQTGDPQKMAIALAQAKVAGLSENDEGFAEIQRRLNAIENQSQGRDVLKKACKGWEAKEDTVGLRADG